MTQRPLRVGRDEQRRLDPRARRWSSSRWAQQENDVEELLFELHDSL